MLPEQSLPSGGDLPEYARVHIVDAPFHVDRAYYYFLPPDLRSGVSPGTFVIVPFGSANKKQAAVVTELVDSSELEFTDKIKPVLSLIFGDFILDSEFLQLCDFMRETTFCTYGQAVRALIPPAAFGKISEHYYVCGELPQSLSRDIQLSMVFNYLKNIRSATAQRVSLDLSIEAARPLRILLSNGIISSELEYRESGGRVYLDKILLCIPESEARSLADSLSKRAPRQSAVLELLLEGGEVTADSLKESLGDIRDPLKKLTARGAVKVERTELYRDPYASKEPSPPPDANILNDAQRAAFEKLSALCDENSPRAALLEGITGSGKTRVIKALADHVIESGGSVILLIPEIALTPQTVDYFRSCYGDRIAVIHSSLSQGERLDMWNRIRRGEVDICVGTRSAVFAPFKRIGMIVVDEEQEHTYKSDMDPKYHARDVARFRCAYHNALMLLSSATPSLESRYKAETGVYSLVRLDSRYGEARLPEVIVADMRQETAAGNTSPIGQRLRAELETNLARGEQSILFLNRRGYNNFVTCPQCGNVITCPHCSVSLTYHTYRLHGEKGGGYLSCHYCGARQELPKECPSCGGTHLTFMGYGTQKVEQELNALFPSAKVLRMDADTTGSKFAYEEIIGDFRSGNADILIGTQMVTKGHDFPNVTLSAVLSADSALYFDDYHAAERTFAMICQLVGRAGRGSLPGRALIQTYNPEHPVITLAAAQDYDSFYKNEIAMRRALIFPPFCDIALITLISEDEAAVSEMSGELGDFIRKSAQTLFPTLALDIFGPFEAPVYKVKEKYRIRVVVKCRMSRQTRKFLRYIYSEWSARLGKTATITLDVNPNSL